LNTAPTATAPAPPEAGFRRLLNKVEAAATRERAFLAFVWGLVAACLIYRVLLGVAIYGGTAQAPGLQPDQVPLNAFLKAPLRDVWTVLVLAFAYLGFKSWLRWRLPRITAARWFVAMEHLAAGGTLLLITLVLRAHLQLLLELETGLTVTAITMATRGMGFRDFLHMFTGRDVAFLLAPLVVFALAWRWESRVRRASRVFLGVLAMALLLLQLVPSTARLTR
jgi:hypothetical protein